MAGHLYSCNIQSLSFTRDTTYYMYSYITCAWYIPACMSVIVTRVCVLIVHSRSRGLRLIPSTTSTQVHQQATASANILYLTTSWKQSQKSMLKGACSCKGSHNEIHGYKIQRCENAWLVITYIRVSPSSRTTYMAFSVLYEVHSTGKGTHTYRVAGVYCLTVLCSYTNFELQLSLNTVSVCAT